MYKIRILTDTWHEIQNDNLKVLNPVLKEKLNGCGSFSYSVPVSDTYYNDYERFKTKVEISEDGAVQFIGRLLETKKDFVNTLTLTFEGEMALLNDVQYPPYEFSGTIAELFTNVIDYYNSKCSSNNQITKGNITVFDKNNYIARTDSNYSSCWSVLSKKLVELCGGYLCMRWVINNHQVYRYLDYLEEAGTLSTQEIEYGENIIDLTQNIEGQDIITCIIPFGAKDEATGEKIDITSVNPTGKNYILSDNVSIFGRIEKVVEWEDVTLPQNLYTKALAYLSEHDTSKTSIKVNAVDLHAVNVEIARLDVGDKVKVKSIPHNIDTTMLITERTRNLNDVSRDTISLGTEEKTFTSSVDSATMNPETQIDEEVVKSLAREQTDILLGGSGGYFEMLYEDPSNPTKPTGFRIMDSESAGTAENVLLVNNNGIGFSNTGVEGFYYNAWTIDGRLSANFISTGILQDSQGNFVLDLDTGTITVGKLTLNTPDLIFGDINNQYIEVTNTIDNKGVLFDGTGEIRMTPTGQFNVQNNIDGEIYNQFLMTQSDTAGNQIYVANNNENAKVVNFLQLGANRKYNDSYGIANTYVQRNYCLADPSQIANYINFISTSDDINKSNYPSQNRLLIYNKKYADPNNANYISLISLEATNSTSIVNYSKGGNYYANSIDCSSNSSSSNNSMTLSNRAYSTSNRTNYIQLFSSSSNNTCIIRNINKDDKTEINANSVELASGTTYTSLDLTNNNLGTNVRGNQISMNCNSSNNVMYINNMARNLSNQNAWGNKITLHSGELTQSGSRNITIANYNNDDPTVISNGIQLYKQDVQNYIDMYCYSQDRNMAQLYLSTFNTCEFMTKDRVNHSHGIHIYTLDSNGNYKDGIMLNGRLLYFSNGYVRY